MSDHCTYCGLDAGRDGHLPDCPAGRLTEYVDDYIVRAHGVVSSASFAREASDALALALDEDAAPEGSA